MLAKILYTSDMENLDYVKHNHLIVAFYKENSILLKRKILILLIALTYPGTLLIFIDICRSCQGQWIIIDNLNCTATNVMII